MQQPKIAHAPPLGSQNKGDLVGALRQIPKTLSKAAVFVMALAFASALPANFGERQGIEIGHSTNWSGYIAREANVTQVMGTFTVPSITEGCDIMQNSAETTIMQPQLAVWIGIGGYKEKSLIQVGVIADQTIWGNMRYMGFFETLPEQVTSIGGFAVEPGDRISAGITRVGEDRFRVYMENMSRSGQVFSGIITYGNALYPAPHGSAEWVVEKLAGAMQISNAESLSGVYYPIAGFNSVDFSGASLLGTSSRSSRSQGGLDWHSIMIDLYGQLRDTGSLYRLASPSYPSSNGADFSVTYEKCAEFAE